MPQDAAVTPLPLARGLIILISRVPLLAVVLNDFMVITGPSHAGWAAAGTPGPRGVGVGSAHTQPRKRPTCDKQLLHVMCGDVFGSHLGRSPFQEAGLGPDPVSLLRFVPRGSGSSSKASEFFGIK